MRTRSKGGETPSPGGVSKNVQTVFIQPGADPAFRKVWEALHDATDGPLPAMELVARLLTDTASAWAFSRMRGDLTALREWQEARITACSRALKPDFDLEDVARDAYEWGSRLVYCCDVIRMLLAEDQEQ